MPVHQPLETTLAFHCAPVLLGEKTASIVCLPCACLGELKGLCRELDGCYGVCPYPLRHRGETLLLMLYHPDRLAQRLAQPLVREALTAHDYDMDAGLSAQLARLKDRCRRGAFPHEIGFFLGYPYEDVQGFIAHRGRGYKYADMWKVYGDVNQAQQLFHNYRHCRHTLTTHLNAGGQLGNFPIERWRRAKPWPPEAKGVICL